MENDGVKSLDQEAPESETKDVLYFQEFRPENEMHLVEKILPSLQEFHKGMISQSNIVRLVRLERVVQWPALLLYEQLAAEDYLEKQYSDISTEWSVTVCLSWRRTQEQPQQQQQRRQSTGGMTLKTKTTSDNPAAAPMSPHQLALFKAMAGDALRQGMQYIWVDCCCVPQSLDRDTPGGVAEVSRSRVYFARSRSLMILPECSPLPSELHMRMLLFQIQERLEECKASPSERFQGCQWRGQGVEALASTLMDALMDREQLCSHEYFGRAWTLAERMSRSGLKEGLRHCLPLDLWFSMVFDALLSNEGCQAVPVWSRLFEPELMESISTMGGRLDTWGHHEGGDTDALNGMDEEMCKVLLEAVFLWINKELAEEPTLEWLKQYIEEDMLVSFKAENDVDVIYAVYVFFVNKEYDYHSWRELMAVLRMKAKAFIGFENYFGNGRLSGVGETLTDFINELRGNILLSALQQFAAEGNLARVQEIVSLGVDVNSEDMDGTTLLHRSAASGHRDVVAWLVEEGGANVEKSNKGGHTALHWAAAQGHKDIVSYLVYQGGAKVNAVQWDGRTALMRAARAGHSEVVAWLVEKGGADVELRDKAGCSALHRAVSEGHLDVAIALVELGGANIDQVDKRGNNALHRAASEGHQHMVDWLVEYGGADIDAEDEDGDTYMIVAQKSNRSLLQKTYPRCSQPSRRFSTQSTSSIG